jgi:hypothetical protein
MSRARSSLNPRDAKAAVARAGYCLEFGRNSFALWRKRAMILFCLTGIRIARTETTLAHAVQSRDRKGSRFRDGLLTHYPFTTVFVSFRMRRNSFPNHFSFR